MENICYFPWFLISLPNTLNRTFFPRPQNTWMIFLLLCTIYSHNYNLQLQLQLQFTILMSWAVVVKMSSRFCLQFWYNFVYYFRLLQDFFQYFNFIFWNSFFHFLNLCKTLWKLNRDSPCFKNLLLLSYLVVENIIHIQISKKLLARNPFLNV